MLKDFQQRHPHVCADFPLMISIWNLSARVESEIDSAASEEMYRDASKVAKRALDIYGQLTTAAGKATGDLNSAIASFEKHAKQVIKDICQMHRGGGINTHNKYSLLPRFVNEGEVTWEKEDEGGPVAPAAKRART